MQILQFLNGLLLEVLENGVVLIRDSEFPSKLADFARMLF